VTPTPGTDERGDGLTVRLQVACSSGDARTVTVSSATWLIGRDRPCQLRLKSAQVSKQHAAIEIRVGRVYLRDLGSTNGTTINGKTLRDAETQIRHEDEIRIGPAHLRVIIEKSSTTVAAPHEEPESLLLAPSLAPSPAGERDDEMRPEGDPLPTEEMPVSDDSDTSLRVKAEELEGVVVVTPQFPDLDHEEAIEAIRSKLEELREAGRPNRVVINLEFVNHLSRKAIAFLLAHHVRLEWDGGALRICQAHARIIALLDQVRLTMLVDCFPTVDEAVICAWHGVEERAPARS
jgi:anti-anti-sigma factor